MKRMFPSLFLGALLLLVAARAEAAAWTRDPGHFYLQLGTSFSYGSERFLNDASTAPIVVPKLSSDPSTLNQSNYQQLLSDLYFEIGAVKRLTVFGTLGVVSARELNPGGDLTYSTTSVNDLLLGVRGGVLLEPVAISLEARLGFPTGNSKRLLPTSSGDFRGELRLVLSKAFERVPIYFDLEFGFMLRGGGHVFDLTSSAPDHTTLVNFSPQLTLHGEIGASLIKWQGATRLLLAFSADYVGSTQQDATTEASLNLYPANSEVTSINVTLMGFFYKGFGGLLRFSQFLEGREQPKLTTFGGALFATW